MVKNLFTYFMVLSSFTLSAQDTEQFIVKEIAVPINGEIYSPSFKDSTLVVCGTRKDRIAHTHLDKDGAEPIDLYVLNVDSAYAFSRFDKTFRSDFHDGPISFNKKGDRCVVSRNLRLDHRFKAVQKDDNLLGLFESRFENGQWTTPEPLAINSDSYNCTHPALSADGNTLFFASNMKGGQGGYDLWQLSKVDGKWGTPENLGVGVNTSGNEFFPTWINNTIYFSSNRKKFGGMDIYQIDLSGEEKTTRLLGAPLNSEYDDFGLVSQTEGKSGYFTSNRSGSDQLWKFERRFPNFDNCDSIVNDDFCYTLYEETAYELGGIESLVYEWDINGVKKYGFEIDYCFPGPDIYDINVDIIDTIIKKKYANQASYSLELVLEEQPYISSPDSVQIGQAFTLDPSESYLPEVEIEAYYWIISDGTVITAKSPTHTFQKEGQYEVKLGVTGTKNGQPFKDCSYKFMVATKDAVENKTTTQLKPMESFEKEGQVIESNPPSSESDTSKVVHSIEIATSAEKLSDTSEVLNPATEKYIVNTLFNPVDSMYVYSIGEWPNIGDAHATWMDLVQLGYDDAIIFTQEKESLSGLPLNESFTLENIRFDSNKWNVKEEAEAPLQVLVLLLKEVDHVKLLISAHTDATGPDERNLILSQKRAKSILNYLINAGIDADRLESKGFGETQPKYTNETREGRAKNRRVEFKLMTTEKIEVIKE